MDEFNRYPACRGKGLAARPECPQAKQCQLPHPQCPQCLTDGFHLASKQDECAHSPAATGVTVAVSVQVATRATHRETWLPEHETSPQLHQHEAQSADLPARPDRLSALLRGENVELTDEETALLHVSCVKGYALLPLYISE